MSGVPQRPTEPPQTTTARMQRMRVARGACWVIVAALALAFASPSPSPSSAPAPVFVETAADTDPQKARSLREQLRLRLLEEGYPLAPSAEHATRTLRITVTDEGLEVEAQGADTRAFSVASGPVLPLEVVHRAMEALDEVSPRVPPVKIQRPRRYAVHVDGAPQKTSPEQVRGALVDTLLIRQKEVVPLDATPDAVLCAEGQGDALALSRGRDVSGCGQEPVVVLRDSPLDQLSSDDSVDALIEQAGTATVANDEPVDTPTVIRRPRRPAAPQPEPKGPSVRIGARTGIYGRLTAADAAVGTTLRVGKEPGPAGLFDVLMVPASATDISIFETSIGVGFGWMWAVSPIVGLHVQGIGGLQIHRFRQRGADTGHRFDWTAEIPLGASFRLARQLRLDLLVRGGRSGRDREHRVDDVVVWSRSAWRVGASVGLSYGWRPR